MSVKNFGKLVVSLSLPQVVGFVGSIYTLKSVDGWYQTLEKSILTPPNFVFAPIWAQT